MSLWIPQDCPRGLSECISLANIQSDDGGSFICCGHNDGTTREWAGDRFRVCWKNSHVDEMGDYDDADMKDTLSVLAQAISADEHMSREAAEIFIPDTPAE